MLKPGTRRQAAVSVYRNHYNTRMQDPGSSASNCAENYALLPTRGMLLNSYYAFQHCSEADRGQSMSLSAMMTRRHMRSWRRPFWTGWIPTQMSTASLFESNCPKATSWGGREHRRASQLRTQRSSSTKPHQGFQQIPAKQSCVSTSLIPCQTRYPSSWSSSLKVIIQPPLPRRESSSWYTVEITFPVL